MMSAFFTFNFQKFFCKYEGGGVKFTPCPEKNTLEKPGLIRVTQFTFTLYTLHKNLHTPMLEVC